MSGRKYNEQETIQTLQGLKYLLEAEITRLRADVDRLSTAGEEAHQLYLKVSADRVRLRTERDALLAALKPFADAVYNDNGSMTITPCGTDEYAKAYFVMRRAAIKAAEKGK